MKKVQEFVQFAGEMVKVGKHAFQHGSVIVPLEEKKRRMIICSKCPYYEIEKNKCGICGCKMEWKSLLTTSTCPLETPNW